MGLFKPGWMNKDINKAIRAVGKLTDQTKLVDAARNAPSLSVRIEALERLNDQAVLIDVAKNGKEAIERKTAVKRITDKKVLADIAKNEVYPSVRFEAAVKLNDQAILLDLAKNDSSIRSEAIRKMSPESLKSIMLFCCDADTSSPEKEEDNTHMQKVIASALEHELPKNFSKLFTDIDEYKKVSKKFMYREEERKRTTSCGATETFIEKYGFNFPPFKG